MVQALPLNSNAIADSQPSLQKWLHQLTERIIAGEQIGREEALALTQIQGQEKILLLCEAADKVRQACCGNTVDLCSITLLDSTV